MLQTYSVGTSFSDGTPADARPFAVAFLLLVVVFDVSSGGIKDAQTVVISAWGDDAVVMAALGGE